MALLFVEPYDVSPLTYIVALGSNYHMYCKLQLTQFKPWFDDPETLITDYLDGTRVREATETDERRKCLAAERKKKENPAPGDADIV